MSKQFITLVLILISTIPLYSINAQTQAITPIVDTFIYEGMPTTSYGSDPRLIVGKGLGGKYRSLILFDLTNLPSADLLESATLNLTIHSSTSPMIVKLHSIEEVFDNTATWLQSKIGFNWTNPGGDYNPTIEAEISIPQGAADGVKVSANVTEMVKRWLVTGGFHGILMESDMSSTWVEFYSSESLNITMRPILTLKFHEPVSITFTVSPSEVTSQPGKQKIFSLLANSSKPVNVQFSVSGLPTGFTYTLNPTSGTTPTAAILTVIIPSNVAEGSYTFQVICSSQSTQIARNITINIQTGTFQVTVLPKNLTAKTGEIKKLSVHVSSIGGFQNPVTLSLKNIPSDWEYTFSVNGLTPPFDSNLTIYIPESANAGVRKIQVAGTAGDKRVLTELTINVQENPGFRLESDKNALNLKRGGEANLTIKVLSISGYSGKVDLSVYQNGKLIVKLNDSGGIPPFNVNVLVKAPKTSETGNYTIQIRGESGGLMDSVNITIRVEAAIASFKYTVSIKPQNKVVKCGEKTSFIIAVDTDAKNPDKIELKLTGLPNDSAYYFTPAELTPPSISKLTVKAGKTPGDYVIKVQAICGDTVVETYAILTIEKGLGINLLMVSIAVLALLTLTVVWKVVKNLKKKRLK